MHCVKKTKKQKTSYLLLKPNLAFPWLVHCVHKVMQIFSFCCLEDEDCFRVFPEAGQLTNHVPSMAVRAFNV
jgi:hypothetical protein